MGMRMAAITGEPRNTAISSMRTDAPSSGQCEREAEELHRMGGPRVLYLKEVEQVHWDVPVLTGINPTTVTSDNITVVLREHEQTRLINHFLIEGLSPEGTTLEQALGGKKPIEKFSVGPKEMKEIFDLYPPKRTKPEIVTIRFPLTVERLYQVSRLFEGKKVSKNVSFSVDLTLAAKLVAERFGFREKLEKSGVLVAETQGQVMWKGKIMDPWVDAKRLGIKTMVTDSLKDCNAIGQQEVDMVLLPTIEQIIEVAITGKL